MRLMRGAISASTLFASTFLASPAFAGDEVLYASAPSWVSQSELPNATDGEGPSDLLWDWQYRLEGGVVYAFTDQATRIDNPERQMEMNQLTLSWLPDKGDLTVHRLEIHRAGEVRDLIAEGVTFEVIRREMGLEQRLIDGELTATLSVPGLRVGDVLRIAHSVSTDDQALGDEVQALQYLYNEPWQVGSAQVTMSWPQDDEMYWRVEDRVTVAEPVLRDGYKYLTIDMPLAEPDSIPGDAPFRYRRPSILRVGSFADWPQLSAVMAPHYIEAATLAPDSEVAAQARTIMQASDDPLVRAAMAVRLVQEEVSYLLDGLNGGNYLPQSAETTWDVRYGDCKAKTVLLLAILQEMGIESEAVLVATQAGDAVPEVLPQPAAFNHVIVHATIGGVDYWLDGTMTGTRLATLADVPNFYHALPIRAGGADLVPLTPRDLAVPQMTVALQVDHSAGVDLPALFKMEMRIAGPSGTAMRAMADEDNPAVVRQMAQRFSSGESDMIVSDFSIAYDEDEALALIQIEGVMPETFTWRDGRLRGDTESFDQGSGFNPDRARRAWREIPVATGGPIRQLTDTTMLLPDGGRGYTLKGEQSFAGGFGNLRATREARIENGAMHDVTEIFVLPGEIAAADVSEAKRAARRMSANSIELVPPQEVTWRWELDAAERRKLAEPIRAAYTAAIDFAEEDDFLPLQWRAYFNQSVFDFEAALIDFDTLVDKSPSPWAYHQRSLMHRSLGNEDLAIADLEQAYELEPNNDTAHELARRMAYAGRMDDALDLMDSLPVMEEERIYHTDALASLIALEGDVAGGFALLEEGLADQPQNSSALNGDCWFRGLFSYQLETALDRCTQAVERAGDPSAALDSRALVHFRQGQMAAAIEDLDTVLELAPGVAESMYLRGIARLHAGDAAGQRDISEAVLMAPYLPAFYAAHGITPPS